MTAPGRAKAGRASRPDSGSGLALVYWGPALGILFPEQDWQCSGVTHTPPPGMYSPSQRRGRQPWPLKALCTVTEAGWRNALEALEKHRSKAYCGKGSSPGSLDTR